jgi:hypothetical protein
MLSNVRIDQASSLNYGLESRRLCSTDALHFYFGGTPFKSWPGCQLS